MGKKTMKIRNPRPPASKAASESGQQVKPRISTLGAGSPRDAYELDNDDRVEGSPTSVGDTNEEEKGDGRSDGGDGFDQSIILDNPLPEELDVEMVSAMTAPAGSSAAGSTAAAALSYDHIMTERMNAVPPRIDYSQTIASEFDKLITYNHFFRLLGIRFYSATDRMHIPKWSALPDRQTLINAIMKMFLTAGYVARVTHMQYLLNFELSAIRSYGEMACSLLSVIISARKAASQAERRQLEIDAHAIQEREEEKEKHDQMMEKARILILESTGLTIDELKVAKEEVERNRAIVRSLEERLNQTHAENEALKSAATVAAETKPVIKQERQIMQQDLQKFSDNDSDIFGDHAPPVRGAVAATSVRASVVADLKEFSGRDDDEAKASNWLKRARTAFRRDYLTTDEICLTFPELLTGPALNWYRQLPRKTRANWDAVLEAFKAEYCGESISSSRKYYEMRRFDNEKPIDYLHRLNVQATRAKIPYLVVNSKEAKEHVDHFIDTVRDDDLAKTLVPICLQHVSSLKETLVSIRRSQSRKKIERTPFKAKPIKREPAIRQVSFTGQLPGRSGRNWASSDSSENDQDQAMNEFHMSGSSESEESDRADQQAREAKSDQFDALLKIFATMGKKAPDRLDRPRLDRKPAPPCTHCGSEKHRDLDCWRRLTCQMCGKQGHPTDRCFQTCKGCGKVHDRGECELDRMARELRKWFKPEEHSAILPTALVELLN